MFEFDRKKSKDNKTKHGIDFIEAQELWRDTNKIVFKSTHHKEERLLVTGELNAKLWTVIITLRKDKVRIISVRRARDNEKKLTISAKKLDKLFDEGADMTPYFDFDNPMSWDEFLEKHKIGIKQKRMNLDLPEWIMQKVDIQAERFGMARQALIRSWILEKLGISTAVKPTSA